MLNYVLLGISGLLYASALLFPEYCWWASAVFLVPFFYVTRRYRVTFFDASLWFICGFMPLLFPVAQGLFTLGHGSWYLKIMPGLCVILLYWLYTCIWFYATRYAPIISTWLFFVFIEHASLFFMGNLEGCLFFNPLLPLIPIRLALIILIAAQAHTLTTLALWLYILLACTPLPPAQMPDNIVCISTQIKPHDSVIYTAQVLCKTLTQALQQHPTAKTFVFPESAVLCPLVLSELDCIRTLPPELTLIIGGCRWDNDIYRNTVYWVHNGCVQDIFDKRHAMAVTERPLTLFKTLFFHNYPGVTPSSLPRPRWNINQQTIIPYVCSELFCNTMPDHAHKNGLIIALCNDAWLPNNAVRKLMLLGTRWRAVQWQQPILYVGYHYQAYCTPNGSVTPCPVIKSL